MVALTGAELSRSGAFHRAIWAAESDIHLDEHVPSSRPLLTRHGQVCEFEANGRTLRNPPGRHPSRTTRDKQSVT
ncbi:hypothetical protein SKAU_G00146580 [Synaphobranchus kaupii]|uniref:Uncharacterized protein n=1 Tax=Synaphobranchus kaupii TaxID=118154 RepID=A0A9Q1FTE9_SYNKA|nr:hypothetical protein SKAU_G00146580 [Synaphobranchus kaupii]